jgi:hypothetical protein
MRKVGSWYLGLHSPEIRFVKPLCTPRWLNERDIGQEGVRPRSDRRRLGQDMGTRRSQRRLGLYLRVHTGSFNAPLCIDSTSPSRSSNKMPLSVKGAIKNAAIKEGDMTEEEANKWIAKLEWEGRLVEECWS